MVCESQDLHAATLRMLDLNTAILTDADSVVRVWNAAL